MEDVTNDFLGACKSYLRPGDVAHEKCFGLQHAMSAIDINNPSMDVGMLKERKITFLLDAIDSNLLPLIPFTDLKVLLGIMDELLTSFVNWLTGDTLAQTVFTCMYMHCIPIIEDKKLALFCEALRRVIYGFRQLILTLPVFEEEDFSPMTYGVPLYKNTSSSFPDHNPANSLFDTNPDCFSSMLKEMEKAPDHSPNETHDVTSAISSRFIIVRCLLQLLDDFSPVIVSTSEAESEDSLEVHEGFGVPWRGYQDTKKSDNPLEPFEETCTKVANTAQELSALFSLVLKTSELGKDAGPGKLSPRNQPFTLPGFEPFLTQAFLPSTIQRFPKTISRSAAFKYLACAFSRVKTVMEMIGVAYTNNSARVILFHELWAPVHHFGYNTCHSFFQMADSAAELEISEACKKTCVLSRAIMSICISAISQLPLRVDCHFNQGLHLETPGLHFLVSWLSIESKEAQTCLLDNLPILNRVGGFFNYVGTQLITICRGHAFNRSRQRSNLERFFRRIHELLEDACSVEGVLMGELVQAGAFQCPQPQSPTPPSANGPSPQCTAPQPTLHLAAYICFFYYHLVWDYLVTGFQLELLYSHEWPYAHVFVMTIQRSLASLLTHIMKAMQSDTSNASKTTPPTTTKVQSTTTAPPGRRRRRGKNNLVGGDSVKERTVENCEFTSPQLSHILQLPPFNESFWNYQAFQTNIHRFMCAGTVHAIRAIQQDIGIDLRSLVTPKDPLDTDDPRQYKFFGSVRIQFFHRLWAVIGTPNSPLADSGGPEASFQSIHEYLTGKCFSEKPTTELYQLASKLFGVAREWIKSTASLGSPENNLGPVDSFAQLDYIAKNNDIVCRLLAARPEKRPRPPENSNRGRLPNLLTSMLMQIDFNYLPSRVYPLLKLK